MARNARGLPAVNILPPEYRRTYLTRAQRMLLLLLAAAVAVVVLSSLPYQGERQEIVRLQAEERRLTTEIQQLQPQLDQAEQLRQEIASLRLELEQLQQLEGVIGGDRLRWDPLLTDLLVSAPPGIELAGVTKEEGALAVIGASSAGFSALVRYVRRLDANDSVAEVIIDTTQARSVDDGNSGAESEEVIDFSLSLILAEG